jgi:membrane protease subunit (stomatin/prohibitin family)
MVRLRGHGIYAYHLVNPLVFHQKVSGTRAVYSAADLEGQLRNTIIGRVSDAFASSQIPFLDMAANLDELGKAIGEKVAPTFAELGLQLDSFVVENLSLPDELQKRLDERIGMNMVGNLRDYTQFQVAQSIPTAAANEGGGGAGLGAGIGAGMAMGKAMADAIAGGGGQAASQSSGNAAQTAGETKFCVECGKSIPRASKFCPECGKPQG